MNKTNKMIRTRTKKGFSLTFANNWTISVQFGYGNYCQNKNHPAGVGLETQEGLLESIDAEIAIWDENGTWYNFGGDTVQGYCDTNELADWISKVSKFD